MKRISVRARRSGLSLLLALFAAVLSPSAALAQLSECVQAAFEEAIAAATDDMILFECDGTIMLTNTVLVESDLTIDGTGHDITFASPGGTNGVRLFTVAEGARLTLINVKLVDGVNTNGGAIYVSAEAFLDASRCFFSNNAALGVNGLSGKSASTNEQLRAGKDGRDAQAGGSVAGGAIYNLGVVTLTECRFMTNTVAGGGGGDGGNGGDGTFTGGDGGRGARGGSAMGGAIYNAGELYATNCTFHEGRAVGGFGGFGGLGGDSPFPGKNGRGGAGGPTSGGGILTTRYGFATIVNSTFSFNGAASGDSSAAESRTPSAKTGLTGPQSSGGGLANHGTNILINCSFFANVVVGGAGGAGGAAVFRGGKGGQGGAAWGGGVFNGGKSARFYATNCTFSDGGALGGTNGAGGSAVFPGDNGKRGPSRGANVSNSNGLFYVHNTLIAYPNPGTNAYGKFRDSGHNLSSDLSIKFTRGSGSFAGLNPLLEVLKDNGGPVETLELLTGSPAVDMGDTNFCLPADARGALRPSGARCDVGAYEAGQRLLPPAITSGPASQVAQPGATVIFRVVATGDPPITYQWQFNGGGTNGLSGDIDGATNSSYMIVGVTDADEGEYTVVVANNSGSATSEPGSLTLLEAPTITEDPEGVSVRAGDSFTLTVVAEGDEPLRYRWLTNGIPIPGAILDHYTVAAAGARDARTYSVEVCNDVACVVSGEADVTVTFAAPVILVPPADQTVARNSTATFFVQASGSPAPHFFWRRGATTLFADTNSSHASSFVILNAQTNNAGSYFVVVSNSVGMVTSAVVSLTVQTVSPSITVQPVGATLVEGTNYTLSVAATGSAPFSYQWYRDGFPVAGALSSNLTFAPVRGTNAGTYTVIVGNTVSSITSSQAVISVILVPPTITQDLSDIQAATGDSITFSPTVAGSFLVYQWFFNGTNAIAGQTNSSLTLASVQLTNSGTYHVMITNTVGATESLRANLNVVESPPVFQNAPADVIADPGTSATFSASASGSKPFLYQWFLNGASLFSPTNGNFAFTNIAGSLLSVTNTTTNSTLTVTSLHFADEGDYHLRISNSKGTNDSAPAVLDVNGN